MTPAESGPAGSALPWPVVPPSAARVRLRAFRDSDLPLVAELAGDPYVRTTMSLPEAPTAEQYRAWLLRQQEFAAAGSGWSFVVESMADGLPVGRASLRIRDRASGRVSGGYVILPSHRGSGLAVDALAALTGFAWSVGWVRTVVLHIEPWNTASVRTAERAGYRFVGAEPGAITLAGEDRDAVVYAATRPGQPA